MAVELQLHACICMSRRLLLKLCYCMIRCTRVRRTCPTPGKMCVVPTRALSSKKSSQPAHTQKLKGWVFFWKPQRPGFRRIEHTQHTALLRTRNSGIMADTSEFVGSEEKKKNGKSLFWSCRVSTANLIFFFFLQNPIWMLLLSSSRRLFARRTLSPWRLRRLLTTTAPSRGPR